MEEVLEDLNQVERAALSLGLQLNHAKSELICVESTTRETMLSAVPVSEWLSRLMLFFLDLPLGVSGVDDVITAKREALQVMGGRLQYLHDALCLLRHAFSLPKMLFTLRTSPCFLLVELESFDLLQISLLGSITNIGLLDSVMAWTQASLLIRSGA